MGISKLLELISNDGLTFAESVLTLSQGGAFLKSCNKTE